MNLMIKVAIIYILLLLFPIGLGIFWYFRNKDSVLKVKQDRRRDPRYFARSFETLFLKAWPERKDGTITLSKKESYLLADEMEHYEEEIKKLLVAEKKELCPPAYTKFLSEIYSWQNVHFSEGSQLRAVHTKGDLILGHNVRVIRWADADGTVVVYDDCDLGMSVTSGTAMTIGKNCSFRRLFAPVICTGTYPDLPQKPEYERKEWIYSLKDTDVLTRVHHGISTSDENEDGYVPSSFVTTGNGVVEEGVIVQGGIRSHKGIRLAEQAVVCGDIFAEGDVYLCRHSTVLGNVFAQGDVYCEKGVVIGRQGRVSSLIARGEIVLEDDCFIYGYVSNEAGGTICPISRQDEVPEERTGREERYLYWPKPSDTLIFETAQDFLLADVLGYRHDHTIRKVYIPEGVKEIPESMFFDCPNLEEVRLPSTLEKIGDYAFAGCKSLKDVGLGSLRYLKHIGRNAFEGCWLLEEMPVPVQMVSEDADFFYRIGLTRAKAAKVTGPALLDIYSHHNSPYITEPVVLEASRPSQDRAVSSEASTGVLRDALPLAGAGAAIALTSEGGKKSRWPAGRRFLRRLGYVSLTVLLFVAMAGAVYLPATLLAQKLSEESAETEEVVREVDQYRNQGLLEGTELASIPELITEEYVVFEDRVLARSTYTDEELASNIEVLRTFLESLANRLPDVDAYVTVAPLRIAFEDVFSTDVTFLSIVDEEKERLTYMEDSILSAIGDLATGIPLMDVLDAHKEEYIFYRTSSSWTARGAYYAAQEFLEAAGLETFSIDTFWEYGKSSTTGSFYVTWNLLDYADRQYYYLYEGYNPLIEVLETGEKRLMFSLTRSSAGAFIGSGQGAYKIDGLAENGRSVMVIGRSNAAVCVPWLVTQFETIIYINISNFSTDDLDLWQMFSDYGITDVLIVEDDDTVSSSRFQSILEQLAEQ